ncbi:hypothetical protein [Flavisolibacter ginsenosidimutans]|uniref:Uncharacterized protein n=1 Tax=Flavisolibacter ginsenosidimutans TaxID=661481 RepID=A0A5B8UGL0_9BACT|nr:hypothetical protein [Flavisolibacter ginsenosidimutans]QEC55505.1 hypothetical protein FSB75_06170 [Flavisolibacter ginsenosidimutans]
MTKSKLSFQTLSWVFILFSVVVTFSAFKLNTGYPQPQTEITFFTQSLSKQKVTDLLLQTKADHYIFQSYLKKDVNHREKYDLMVHIYDSKDSLLNSTEKKIFKREPSLTKYVTTEDVALSIFGQGRAQFDHLIQQHPNYQNLIFQPIESGTQGIITYRVSSDATKQPLYSEKIFKNNEYILGVFSNDKQLLTPGDDYFDFNPSPPRATN